jgi:di/tricarboxylate transporter
MFHIKNGLKEGDALLSLLSNFAVEYDITKVTANHQLLKFNGTHQVIIMLMMLIHGVKAYMP